MSMGLEANQDVAFALRDSVTPNAAAFLTVGKGIAATPMAGPTGEARLGIPYGAATPEELEESRRGYVRRRSAEVRPNRRRVSHLQSARAGCVDCRAVRLLERR